MAAWRYEISFRVLKKYFTRSLRSPREIFFNTRGEISYLRAAMQYPLFIDFFTDICPDHKQKQSQQ